jgi:hypothetical protein
MPTKGKTEKLATLTEEEPEVYEGLYVVNFNNCTFNEKVVINQTGVPPDPDDDPPEE